MILTSALLSKAGVRHGFSTRRAGDLGLDTGEREIVLENRRRFAEETGLDRIVQVEQVHGTAIWNAAEAAGHQGDGLVSTDPDLAVGVRTADCAPVLIAASDGRAVAAVHAGWRGAVAGIVTAAVERLEAIGASRKTLLFAIGPTIGLEAFEVGDEVIEAAARSLGGDVPPRRMGPRGKWHLDLVRLIELQLGLLGVSPDQIDRVGGCTFSDRSMYFSYRRDRSAAGRHLSAVAPKAET